MALNRLPSWARKPVPVFEPEQISSFLHENKHVLEEFLVSSTPTKVIEGILAKKKAAMLKPEPGPSVRRPSKETPKRNDTPVGVYTNVGMQKMCQQIISCVEDEHIFDKIYEMCRVIACSTNSSGFLLFVLKNYEDLARYTPETGATIQEPSSRTGSVANFTAKMKKPMSVENVHLDERFPNGTGVEQYHECHVLALPVVLECNTVYCIVEFVRPATDKIYEAKDIQITNGMFCWLTACVQKMKMNRLLNIQESLNKFLLDSTKVMFDDMVDTDRIIMVIMSYTKKLVSADRCSLFLVDEERNELYADYFDEGLMDEEGQPMFHKKPQIRFRKDKGIAGAVAQTGEIVNIKDAYADDRFNTDIDKKTGYRTRNILCMPIKGKTGVIAVVQMVNRLNGNSFTLQDMSSFKMFAVYCALALHYSRLYTRLFQSQMNCRIAMDMMQFHISCSEDEVKELVANPIIPAEKIPPDFYHFNFCCYDYDRILPELFITMMRHTFGNSQFDLTKMCRFVLTVRKNYRPIQYHNWQHGFHVAHSIWRMIESAGFECSTLEKMAFLVGGVCHDVDHRGFNNEFFKKLQHPLAALYPTSVMEQHHFKQAIAILHEEGRDIFSSLSSQEHKQVVDLIRRFIMATDLATFFPNNKFLQSLIEKSEFDIGDKKHRDALFALIMTSSDLCAITKPWKTQNKTAEMIYDEFYMQGDAEKRRGLQPIPMMDRDKQSDIPKMQVGFVNFVCKPMYATLYQLLPKTKCLLDGCNSTKDNWEAVVAKQHEIVLAEERIGNNPSLSNY